MNARELRELDQWVSRQSKDVRIEFPDREPGEEKATKKQLNYIRGLANNGIDEAVLATLGKWQASAVITQLKAQQEIFTAEAVEAYRAEHPRRSFGLTLLMAVLVAAFAIVVWIATH